MTKIALSVNGSPTKRMSSRGSSWRTFSATGSD